MQKRILPIAFIAAVLFSLFTWNCTKLDVTDVGSDQIPAVDNVHTFDTTLDIISTQAGIFSDSTYISKSDDYALGAVNNDPLFGKTNAHIFMQLKPPFYPYYWGNSGDTIVRLDSVILCLKYKGFWGDSSKLIHLDVREVVEDRFKDSVFKENTTNYQPNYSGTSLATADIDVRTLGNYVKFTNGRDSVNYQVRIKLPSSPGSWGDVLFKRDSLPNSIFNNAFYSDSLYKRFYNGIAVISSGTNSNGLMYINIADTGTKIEVHYVKRKNGKVDSVYQSLKMNTSFLGTTTNQPSNATNNIVRDRTGSQMLTPSTTMHYLQTAPGSFVNLSIPGLAGLDNRIIHRAEIIVEQVPDNPVLDAELSEPDFMYVDLKDTGTNKWKPVYFDLNTAQGYDPDNKISYYPFIPNQINFNYFGGYTRDKVDALGSRKWYTFNISRYVQQLVTKRTYNYDFRLYAPYNMQYPQYSSGFIPYGNKIALGRVRIGSGTHPLYKLRLRIIYSKI